MQSLRLLFATVVVINLCPLSNVHAMDLYVDTKTKQIFAEPGAGCNHWVVFAIR